MQRKVKAGLNSFRKLIDYLTKTAARVEYTIGRILFFI